MSALRLGLLGILLLAATFGLTPLAVLYGAALMLGLTETFTQSGFIALLPMIVPSGRLDRANTFLVGAQQVIEMVAAPLGGLLATAGLLVAVGVGGAGYGAALVALVFLRGTFRPQRPTTRHVLAEVMEGLRFLWSHALLRTIGLMAGVINACWAAWLAVLVLYAVAPGPMKLTAFEYGLLFTAGGIGGLFGVLLLAPLRHALGQRWAIGLNILGNAVMFVAPAITADRWVVGSAIVLGSAVGPMWTITATALQQRIVHERLQGRVSAAYRLLALGAESVGAALGGVVAQVFGVQTVFWVAAVLTLAMLPPFLLIVTEQAMAAGE